ncbi:MAG TPA: peptidase M24, partial [Gemmatimonadetes bacterium]|nr:peptidase M24 [Gemmatimonadota bacterium]
MSRWNSRILVAVLLTLVIAEPGGGQEARARWERMCQIRAEKFDLVLP